jgi:hypothetical protein
VGVGDWVESSCSKTILRKFIKAFGESSTTYSLEECHDRYLGTLLL